MKPWLCLRIAFVAASALAARDMVSPEALAESDVTWVVPPIVAAMMLPFVTVGMYVAVRVSSSGRGPRWDANPFTSFIDFFHMGAWACLSAGVASVIVWLTSSPDARPVAVTYLVFGAAAVVGTRVGTAFGERAVAGRPDNG